METEVAVLLLGGLELNLGPGVFTELVWIAEAGRVGVAGAECSLFPPHTPQLLNGYRAIGTLSIEVT
eukprot:1141633-Pelagomonas_calceolata.AAC.3